MSDFELKESKVQGSGIFATKDLGANKVLFETHKKTSGALEWINLIPNCSYNHSVKPNCRSLTFGDYKYLVTLSNIENGEELLVDYNKDKDLEQPEEGWG
tara:strand:- start:116 stop:415 length:300 start_codon:yes stop_codon:yes gene_type:complete